MTQPTQAQIEAIRQTLWSSSCFRDVCQMLPCKCAEEIAALTAEAEEKPEFGFGPPETAAAEAGYSEPQGTGFQAGEAEPAAAETREQEELETKRLNEIERLYRCIEAYRSELNRAREGAAATIERCAQVAEQDTNPIAGIRIAAAIRAMKEQL